MKKYISILLVLLCLTTLTSCNGEPNETQATDAASGDASSDDVGTEESALPDREIVIADGSSSSLYVIIPRRSTQMALYARDKLSYFVESTTGAKIKSGSGNGEDFELILGNVNRDEVTELKKKLNSEQYGIKISGGKIVIAAHNLAFLYDAMDYFINNYLTVSENKIVVNTLSDIYIGRGDKTSLLYKLKVAKDNYITADIKRENNAPHDMIHKVAESPIAQGGCFDGEYFYQAFINKDKASNEAANICYIVKSKPDMNTDTNDTVLVSKQLSLNHANDITYNSRTHELIVAHNNPNRTTLSIVDPDTLVIKSTFSIPYSIYSITYSPQRNIYMVGLAGGQSMRYLSADFKEIAGSEIFLPTDKTEGYITQGICSDDIFVYHTLWNNKGSADKYNINVIVVYDWYGNFIGIIGTEIDLEGENISVNNGTIYISAANAGTGAYLYCITP